MFLVQVLDGIVRLLFFKRVKQQKYLILTAWGDFSLAHLRASRFLRKASLRVHMSTVLSSWRRTAVIRCRGHAQALAHNQRVREASLRSWLTCALVGRVFNGICERVKARHLHEWLRLAVVLRLARRFLFQMQRRQREKIVGLWRLCVKDRVERRRWARKDSLDRTMAFALGAWLRLCLLSVCGREIQRMKHRRLLCVCIRQWEQTARRIRNAAICTRRAIKGVHVTVCVRLCACVMHVLLSGLTCVYLFRTLSCLDA